jgi:hypothetical protein
LTIVGQLFSFFRYKPIFLSVFMPRSQSDLNKSTLFTLYVYIILYVMQPCTRCTLIYMVSHSCNRFEQLTAVCASWVMQLLHHCSVSLIAYPIGFPKWYTEYREGLFDHRGTKSFHVSVRFSYASFQNRAYNSHWPHIG